MVFYIYIYVDEYLYISFPFLLCFLCASEISPFFPCMMCSLLCYFARFSLLCLGKERWEGLHAGLTSFDKYFGSFVAARMFNIYPCLSVERLRYEWFSQ